MNSNKEEDQGFLHCIVCDKYFKSEAACQNHQQSTYHRRSLGSIESEIDENDLEKIRFEDNDAAYEGASNDSDAVFESGALPNASSYIVEQSIIVRETARSPGVFQSRPFQDAYSSTSSFDGENENKPLCNVTVYHCTACNKCFRTHKSCFYHERSKKHKEKVHQIEQLLEEELRGSANASFDEGQQGNEEGGQTEADRKPLTRFDSLDLPKVLARMNAIEEITGTDVDCKESVAGRQERSLSLIKEGTEESTEHYDTNTSQPSIKDDKENEQGGEGGEVSWTTVFNCVVCDKHFKSEKACQNHEKSRRHKEGIRRLENEMEKNKEEKEIEEGCVENGMHPLIVRTSSLKLPRSLAITTSIQKERQQKFQKSSTL